eukprot:TRINITY_DN615_c0_g1_i2.p1 TRINITY_DN615_c0_g1~~TRINITY_DN615_c0_g1_i2.p1  ORF type:complete len:5058 (+),score=1379.07 TRINITY_DN615_c0_g1_i2:1102-15174(+)
MLRFNATVEGSYSLASTINGANVGGGPLSVTITNAPALGATSVLNVLGSNSIVAGQITKSIVYARDSFGNNRTAASDTVTASLTHRALAITVTGTVSTLSTSPATFLVQYNATVTGEYTMSAVINGMSVSGSPLNVTILDAPALGATSLVNVPGSNTIVAGTFAQGIVYARDSYGNNRTASSDTVVSALTHRTLNIVVPGVVTAIAASPATFTIKYNATVIGEYTLSATINGMEISGSPRNVTIINNELFASSSFAYGTGLSDSTTGLFASFFIQGRDGFENNRTLIVGTEFSVVVSHTQHNNVVLNATVTAETPATDGRYKAQYNVTVSGTYSIATTKVVGGKSISGSPFSMVAKTAPTDPRQTVLFGPKVTSSTAGQFGGFVIQARDKFSNNRTVTDDVVLVTMQHQTENIQFNATVTNGLPSTKGQYEVQYNATVSGVYTMRTYLNAVQIQASPKTVVVVTSDTHPDLSYLYGAGLTTGVAGLNSAFVIQSRDSHFNNKTVHNDNYVVRLTHTVDTHIKINASVVIQNDPSGSYYVTYNATWAGTYAMTVVEDGVPVAGSPYTPTIIANPTTLASLSTTAVAPEYVVSSLAAFTIQARDRFGNNRTASNDQVVATLTNLVKPLQPQLNASFNAPETTNGRYSMFYNQTIPGNYSLQIRIYDQHIAGSPFAVYAKTDISHAGTTVAFGRGLTSTVAATASSFIVQSRDPHGNNRTQATDVVTATFTHSQFPIANLESNATILDASQGGYLISYNATVSGTYSVTVKIGSTFAHLVPISNMPQTLTVLPTAPEPRRAIAYSFGTFIAGTEGSFIIQARDGFDNNITQTGGVDFVATLQHPLAGNQVLNATSTAMSGGRYRMTYNLTYTGNYAINVQALGQTIVANPFSTLIIPAETFVPETRAYGPNLQVAEAGKPSIFTIQTRDGFQNNRSVSVDQISISLSTPKSSSGMNVSETVNATVVPGTLGIYTVSYNATIAAQYDMRTFINGLELPVSPTNLVVSPTDMSPANVGVQGNLDAVAGVFQDFYVQSRDVFNNNRTAHIDSVQAVLNHTVYTYYSLNVTVSDDTGNQGRFKLQFNATIAGDYQLHITTNGQTIAGSPFPVHVFPASTHSPQSLAHGAGIVTTVAGTGTSFTVQARDVFENNRTIADDAITVTIVHATKGNVGVPQTIAPINASATYDIGYNTTIAGSYQLGIKLNNVDISGSPFTITTTPNLVNFHLSNVFGNALTSVVAGDLGEFYIQARDSFNNSRTITDDTFVATVTINDTALQPNVSVPAIVTSFNSSMGLYKVRYNATVARSYDVRITNAAKTVDLVGSPQVLVVDPAVVSAARSSISGAGVLSGGHAGELRSFTIFSRDRFDNPRTTINTFAFTLNSSLTGEIVGTVNTPISNQYKAEYNLTVATNYTLSVKVLGEHLQGSPVNIETIPYVTHPQQSVLIDISIGTAGQSGFFRIQARDAFENNRRQVGSDSWFVTINRNATAQLSEANTTIVADSPGTKGQYKVDYSGLTISGTYYIRVQSTDASGAQIRGSPYTMTVHPTTTNLNETVTYGVGLTDAVAGKFGEFVIQARDRFQNNRTSTVETFSVVLSNAQTGSIVGSAQPHPSLPGAYLGRYNATIAQTYTLTVTLSGSQVPSSPFSPSVIANVVHAGSSTVSGEATSTWAFLSLATFDVRAKDAFDNPITITNLPFTGYLTAPSGNNISIAFTHSSQNLYKATYNPVEVGNYTMHVNLQGSGLYASPYPVIIVPEANVSRIQPTSGPESGDTIITVYGNNFVNSPNFLKAYLGGVECKTTTYVSKTTLLCVNQPGGGGQANYTISVTNNGVNITQGDYWFDYYVDEKVISFNPLTAIIYGRSLVTVIGENFKNKPELNCIFGTSDIERSTIASEFISSSEILCRTPPHDIGPVDVGVANNGQQFHYEPAQSDLEVPKFRFFEPFSPMCRTPNELEVGVTERTQLGIAYQPNVAINATVNTTQLQGLGLFPSGIVDGDRCCDQDLINQGVRCGVSFPTNFTDLVTVEITLSREAFINEFVTAWFQPCQNQPPLFDIQIFNNSIQAWSPLISRVTKAGVQSSLKQRPCFFIPSDKDDVSLCIDFLTTEVRSDRFRVVFNNSIDAMNLFAGTETAGNLFEFETHGVFVDIPEFLAFNRDLSAAGNLSAARSVPVPEVSLYTLNHQREPLFSNDTTTKLAYFNLTRSGSSQVLMTSQLAGTWNASFNLGVANFSDLALVEPVADLYTFTYYTDNNIATVTTSVRVIIGPSVYMVLVSGNNQAFQSDKTNTLGPVVLHIRDGGNNFIGTTDTGHVIAANLNNPIPGFTGNQTTSVNGVVTFNALSFTRPVVGEYVISFSTPGVIGVNITFNVLLGKPDSIQLIQPHEHTIASAVSMVIPQINMTILDAGAVRSYLNASTTPITAEIVNVTSGVNNATLTGTLTVHPSNGFAIFTNLRLANTKFGRYVLAFTSPGLANATTFVNVIIGTPITTKLEGVPRTTYPSLVSVELEPIVLHAFDAGDTFVGSTDTANRTVLVNSTSIQLFGVANASMVHGKANFSAISFSAPKIGVYRLDFTIANIAGLSVDITIVVGPVFRLELIGPVSIQTVTKLVDVLQGVSIRAVDAGSTFVGDSDTLNRTMGVYVDKLQDRFELDGRQAQMINGTVTFSQMKFVRMLTGLYTLTFVELTGDLTSPGTVPTGLNNITVPVNVSIGEPYRLNISTTPNVVYASSQSVDLNPITLYVLDPADQLETNAKVNNLQVGIVEKNDSLSTTGPLLRSLTSSVTVYSGISLTLPKVGSYRLILGGSGLLNATVLFSVKQGVATKMVITSASATEYPAIPTVIPDAVTADFFDDADNFASELTGKVVTAVITAPAIGFTSPPFNATTNAGKLSMSNLRLIRPLNGTYLVDLSAAGIQSATTFLYVRPGPAVEIVASVSSVGPFPSQANTPISNISIQVLDINGDVVPSAFALANRTIQLSLVNASSVANATLLGNLQVPVNQSAALFTGLSLVAPPQGSYTLKLTSFQLDDIFVTFNVSIGPAVRLVRTTPVAGDKPSLPSIPLVSVPTIVLKAQDAGGNFVGSTDQQSRTITCSSVATSFGGITSVQMNQGVVDINGLTFTRPRNDTYSITFSSNGLQSTQMEVDIVTGPPDSLDIVGYATTPKSSSFATDVDAITVRTLDAGRGFTTQTNANMTISVSVNGTISELVGNKTLGFTDGLVTFSDLKLVRPPKAFYQLTFNSTGLTFTQVLVNVVIGAPVELVVASQGYQEQRSAAVVRLQPINLQSRDAGDNFVGIQDQVQRTLNVSIVNDTKTPTLFGDLQYSMVGGNASIANLQLIRPSNFVYRFVVSSTGLQSVQFQVRITTGEPSELQLVSATQQSKKSVANVVFDPISVRALDSGRTFVGGTDTQIRPVYVWSPTPFLAGQLVYNMTNGSAVIDNVQFLKPATGSFRLDISTPGTTNVSVIVNITIGPVASLELSSTWIGDFKSNTTVHMTPVTLRALDIGGTFVASTDNSQNRQVSVSIDGMTIQGATGLTMQDGVVTFDAVRMINPVQGNYTLVIRSPGLANITLPVFVGQGPPLSLVSLGFTTEPFPSDIVVQLDPIQFQTLDAGNKPTTEVLEPSKANVIASVDASSQPVTLQGTLSVPVVAGYVNFTNLQFSRPKTHGATPADSFYVLRFSNVVMGSVTVKVFISIGKPKTMTLLYTGPQNYESKVATELANAQVKLFDAGGVFVGTTDIANRTATAVLRNQTTSGSQLVSANTQIKVQAGTATFTGLDLIRPKVGLYHIDISVTGISNTVSFSATVTRGVAQGLTVTGPTTSPVIQSLAVANLPTISIGSLDAGNNLVGDADAIARRVGVVVISSTGGVDTLDQAVEVTNSAKSAPRRVYARNAVGSGELLPLVRLIGTLDKDMVNGRVVFSNLALVAPREGQHTLRFLQSSEGSTQLTPILFTVNVTLGPASSLRIDDGDDLARTYAYGGNKLGRINLPNIRIVLADAGGNIASEAGSRNITMSSPTGINSFLLGNPASSVLTSFDPTSKEIRALFNGLKLTPFVGTYTLTFSSPGLVSSSLVMNVTHGPPSDLIMVNSFAQVIDNQEPILKKNAIMRIEDDVGNLAPVTDITIYLEAFPSGYRGTARINHNMTVSNGVITLSGIEFIGVYGQAYIPIVDLFVNQQLVLQGKRFPTHNITVKRCDQVWPNTEPREGADVECWCSPGYTANSLSRIDNVLCDPCAQSEYKSLPGPDKCTKCPQFSNTGEVVGATSFFDCTCEENYYTLDTDNSAEQCRRCPEGAICNQNAQIRPAVGFFRFEKGGLDKVFECPNDEACQGGGNSTCSLGYEGPLCSVCSSGFGPFGSRCLPCRNDLTQWILMGGSLASLLLVFSLLLRSAQGRKSKLSIMFKILLNYLQVLAMIGEFQLRWSRDVTNMFQFQALSLMSLNVHPVQCTFDLTLYQRFYIYLGMVALMTVIPLGYFSLAYFIRTRVMVWMGFFTVEDRVKDMDSFQYEEVKVNPKLTGVKYRRVNGKMVRIRSEPDEEEESTGVFDQVMKSMEEERRRAKERKDRIEAGEDPEEVDKDMANENQQVNLTGIGAPREVPWTANELLWIKYINQYSVFALVFFILTHPGLSKVTLQLFDCIKFNENDVYLSSDMSVSCLDPEYLQFQQLVGLPTLGELAARGESESERGEGSGEGGESEI